MECVWGTTTIIVIIIVMMKLHADNWDIQWIHHVSVVHVIHLSVCLACIDAHVQT